MDNNLLYNLIIVILIVQYLVEVILEYLNAKRFNGEVPSELKDVYDDNEYKKSFLYKKANYAFGFFSNTFSLVLLLCFIIFGGFGFVDNLVRSITDHEIVTPILFFGIILLGSNILSIPFSYYQTFVIEEKFGFNKTTKKLFFKDLIKSWLMGGIIGSAVMALVILFLQWAGPNFWIYTWAMVTFITLFLNLYYSRLIVPLFNKQRPLESGSLKNEIESYAKKVGFDLKNISVIDGSKRSTKANAYFSGFGKEKRVSLYDTLLNDLEEDEIVAVLAHEVGHYKRHHVVFNLLASVVLTGLTLYLFSLCINYPEISLAIGVDEPSFHAAVLGFALLYSPFSQVTGLVMKYLSRKFEFQADNFAKETFRADPLVTSLKKLSKNNLSNLTPHPAYVFIHYTHPPIIQRIKNLLS